MGAARDSEPGFAAGDAGRTGLCRRRRRPISLVSRRRPISVVLSVVLSLVSTVKARNACGRIWFRANRGFSCLVTEF
jgi:hypothetical protein